MVALSFAAGCEPAPVTPTPLQAPQPTVSPGQQTFIRGQVLDTVWRPVPAALVEIVVNQLVDMRRTADSEGRFEFASTTPPDSLVTLRVSKDGFETTTSIATWQLGPSARTIVTRLYQVDQPSVLGAGEYKLTVDFDLASARGFPAIPSRPEITCLGYPAELVSREFDARISQRSRGELGVSVTNPTVLPFSGFLMYLTGDVAAVDMEWFIGEEFPGFRYLFFGGGPVPRQVTVDSAGVHVPFEADFRYCELTSPRGIYNECSQVPLNLVARQHWCRSDRVTLTFKAR
jgi:hypothetical protein